MSRSDDGAVLVLTTVASDDVARELSRILVGERLAACVTRSAVRSVYRWESSANADGLCEDEEVLLVVKTARSRAAALERRILELHPYDCPELVRVAAEHVEARYLAWLAGATAGDNDEGED